MSSTASRSSLGGRPRRFPAEGCALIYVRVNLYRDSAFRYRHGLLLATLTRVRAAGGEVVLDVDPAARERVAQVRDPGGSVIGVYEQPGLRAVPEHVHTVTHGLGTEVPPDEARK